MPVVQTPASLRRTISVGAAARLTGLHPSTIRRALLRGDLDGYRAGKRGMYRIRPEAIAEWIRRAHESEDT